MVNLGMNGVEVICGVGFKWGSYFHKLNLVLTFQQLLLLYNVQVRKVRKGGIIL